MKLSSGVRRALAVAIPVAAAVWAIGITGTEHLQVSVPPERAISASLASVTVPAAPTAVSAMAGNTSATVSWTAGANGSTAVWGYMITPYVGTTAQATQTFGTATSDTVWGLTNGTTYTFVVQEKTAAGTSAPSQPSNPVLPCTVPSSPVSLSATAGNASAVVSWVPGSDGGAPVTTWIITPFNSGTAGTPVSFNSPATTETMSGLVNGDNYAFQVTGVNVAGKGWASASSNQVTPKTVPGAPSAVYATAGDGQVSVTWAPPAQNGASPITGYTITPVLNGTPLAPVTYAQTATAEIVPSLVNGQTYTFLVAADNAVGTGPNSAPTAPVVPAPPALPLPSTAITVQGDQLVNQNGSPVRLLGVDRDGTDFMCLNNSVFLGPTDATSVQALKSWDINVVRIPLNEDCWLGINGVSAQLSGPAYQQAILQYVQQLQAQGIIAILDLHFVAPGSQLSSSDLAMPDAGHAPAFWQSVATTFKTQPNVIFDLYNEPFGVSWSCWLNGCTVPGATWQAAGMQSLVNAVRSTGATQPIMLSGLNWGDDLSQWLQYEPTDPDHQLIASLHDYAVGPCVTAACWEQTVGPVAAQVPVVAAEIGDQPTGCTVSFLNSFMAWADASNVSYLAWSWNVGQCPTSQYALLSSYNGTPTAYGAAVQAHLLALGQSLPPATTGGALAAATKTTTTTAPKTTTTTKK